MSKFDAMVEDLKRTTFGQDVLDAAVFGSLTEDMLTDFLDSHGMNGTTPEARQVFRAAVDQALAEGF